MHVVQRDKDGNETVIMTVNSEEEAIRIADNKNLTVINSNMFFISDKDKYKFNHRSNNASIN